MSDIKSSEETSTVVEDLSLEVASVPTPRRRRTATARAKKQEVKKEDTLELKDSEQVALNRDKEEGEALPKSEKPVNKPKPRRTVRASSKSKEESSTEAVLLVKNSSNQESSENSDSSEGDVAKEASEQERKTRKLNRQEGQQEQKQDQHPKRSHVVQGSKNSSAQNGNSRQKQNSQKQKNTSSQGGNQQAGNQNHRRQRRSYNNQGNREIQPSISKDDLTKLKVIDLRAKAAELEIDSTGLKKQELIDVVFDASVKAEGFIEIAGILDILADGYGFLRTQGYLPSETDCYVGLSTIRRNGLRKGDMITGQTRPARENDKYAALQKVSTVNGVSVEESRGRVRFGDLTPVYPDNCLTMEHGKNSITARVIDLVSPIGKGQRGLIVSPPKAGKTTILKDIAAAISANNPEVHLMCLLVDERPEEVTDMERSIKGEVISSTFDMPTENHIAVSELVIERAKRLVENGRDVVVLLDSLTRLARAYNLAQPASGRILSGGVDSTALYPPKRFLGAARNIENGGSLTILASALVDTGSKMDEVIFEEFKGTGNMELKLDRYLADRRIFPAIDPVASGTRKEDLLLDPQEAPLIWGVRRLLANMNNTERAMGQLIKSLKQTNTNEEFLQRAAKKTYSSKSDTIEEL